ncbi:hypothetical protein [Williamsia sp. M5A3_1d]
MTHRLLAPITVAVAVAALAGCGSTDNSATTATSTVTVTRSAAPSTQATAVADPPVVTETVTSTERPTDPTAVDTAGGEQGGTTASAFVGHYQRHSSTLDLAADGTGQILEGDGAVDGETWSVTWQPAGPGISITYQRLIRKTGVGLYRHPAAGLEIGATYGTGVTGNRVLAVSQPAPRTPTIIWCLPRTPSPECGA